MKKIMFMCIFVFSFLFIISCSDKIDEETKNVVSGIMADKSFTKKGWTEENAICWVKETKKLISDKEWEIMRSMYDPNFSIDFEMGDSMGLIGFMYVSAETCKVDLPA
jgi:hypothetical protein